MNGSTPAISSPVDTSSAGEAAGAAPDTSSPPRLSWRQEDLETRLGLRGAAFTSARTGVWLLAAALLTAAFFLVLAMLPTSRAVEVFTERGVVPYVVVLLGLWAVLLLLVKQSKVTTQVKAMRLDDVVPTEPDFVLSPGTAALVLERLKQRCADPERFLLFNRIAFALSNLRNMGRIGDVDDVLATRADHDADAAESTYTLLRGLVWAIPVLGFIGTVQGLSVALGAFGSVIQDSADFETLKPALRNVTGGLATAFDTTLLALIAALIVQMLLTLTRKREEDLLDQCNVYCLRHIVGRLRLSPFEAPPEARQGMESDA